MYERSFKKETRVVHGELDLPVGMLSSEAPDVPLTLPLEVLKSEKIFAHSLNLGPYSDVGHFYYSVPY